MTSGRRPCPAPFKTPCIMWDGTVTVCCFDGMMNLNLGNIKEHPLSDIWYGKRADEIRLKMIRGDFKGILTRNGYPKCFHCRGYDTPSITDEEIIHFLKETGNEGEIDPYLRRIH